MSIRRPVKGPSAPAAIWTNIGEMTARKVDAAVVAIGRRDPGLGQWAQAAADGLTAGEGEEILCQAFVQDFLWYRLPANIQSMPGSR